MGTADGVGNDTLLGTPERFPLDPSRLVADEFEYPGRWPKDKGIKCRWSRLWTVVLDRGRKMIVEAISKVSRRVTCSHSCTP